MPGVRRHRRLHEDVIRPRQKLRFGHKLDAMLLCNGCRQKRIVGDDVHAKGLRPIRNGLPDLSEGHDAHRPPAQAVNRLPALPAPDACMGCPIILGQFAGQRQPKRYGVIGHFLGTVILDIRDKNTPV